jgi:cytoskeletal protein RodZ
MPFKIREFTHGQTVGEKLYARRREAGLTLQEAAELTKVRKSVLRAFEQNDYARNFLKAYVQLL